jgi:hypothetical protein
VVLVATLCFNALGVFFCRLRKNPGAVRLETAEADQVGGEIAASLRVSVVTAPRERVSV